MAFLFKSKDKKGQAAGGSAPSSRKLSSRDGSNSNPPTTFAGIQNPDEKLRPFGPPGTQAPMAPSPPPGESSGKPPRSSKGQRRAPTDPSLFPWSRHLLQFGVDSNPFPRYGAAVNGVASAEGDIYMSGGLIEGMDVKGDLWIVEAGSTSLRCYMVPTNGEGPSPRVGHASLLVGNAYVVFGGDTKVNESDILDDTLYLLNTATKQWSRALPAGSRPAGRYGHTLNIIGSKIYIFGGQVEGLFYNDLFSFDLNALQSSSSRWELLIPNAVDAGPQRAQGPSPRTNHTVITYDDRLYLFGGTDGTNWFNDVWIYDQKTNAWSILECIGFIPSPREGHAAALVGDVMYVFGGRSETGHDLGDVAGFKITTRRWYTFQNMGPSPSPRSGHGMCAFGSQIYIFGGEPSTAPRDPVELSEAYILDTAKIRYPEEKQPQKLAGGRRPSVTERSSTPQDNREGSGSRDGSINGTALKTRVSQDSMSSATGQHQRALEGSAATATAATAASGAYGGNGANSQKPTRSAPSPAPTGPPPQQPRTNGSGSAYSTAAERGRESPMTMSRNEKYMTPDPLITSTSNSRDLQQNTSKDFTTRDTSSPKPSQSYNYNGQPRQEAATTVQYPYQQHFHQQQASSDSAQRRMTETPDHTAPSGEDVIQSNIKQPQYADSGVGSSPSLSQQHISQQQQQQHDSLLRDLEAAKSRVAWYASELALARKAGYRTSNDETTSFNPDERGLESFGDDEKPMLEALLRTRSELTQMQDSLATQSSAAATKIAQLEKEKEAAIAEAMYTRTKLQSRDDPRDIGANDSDRADMSDRRLATALAAQTDLSNQIKALTRDLEHERKARELAEQSADAAHTRAGDLDSDKQKHTSEIERLKSELHESELTARDHSSRSAEAESSLQLLQVDKRELGQKLLTAQENSKNHQDVLARLREAVSASSDKAALLEQKLEFEKRQRSTIEEKLINLRGEHEKGVAELESATAKLRDAEELAATHAEEARTHREAVLAGLNTESRSLNEDSSASDERVQIMQQRLDEANTLVQSHKDAANQAAEKLRRAEERIAGLEAYQEQSSREGLSLRKQLQAASKEHLALRSELAELQQQFSSHKLEATALAVQHSTLKNIISERGIDAESLERGLNETDSAANSDRLAELEQQLDASSRANEDMRRSFEQREEEANKGWEAKLTALDNDYQSAVKYLKGTEKMLTKLKQELHRYKTANKDLEGELTKQRAASASRDVSPAASAWETERDALRAEITSVESRLKESTSQLESQMADLKAATAERDNYREASSKYAAELATAKESGDKSRSELESLKQQNSVLEERAAEAERKVQMLLDTVGNSVDNYRRISQGKAPSSPLPNGGLYGQSLTAGPSGTQKGHSRGLSLNSIGADSTSSIGEGKTGGDGTSSPGAGFSRNSLALDSLASELETLRSHWESASKNNSYRSSDPPLDEDDDSDVDTKLASSSSRRVEA